MPWPMVLGWLSAQQPLESLSEFGAENGIDDGVERRVEVTQPQEKSHHMVVECPWLEYCHEQGQNEKWKPAGNKRPGGDGQSLCHLSLSLDFKRDMFFLLGWRVVLPLVDPYTVFQLCLAQLFEVGQVFGRQVLDLFLAGSYLTLQLLQLTAVGALVDHLCFYLTK